MKWTAAIAGAILGATLLWAGPREKVKRLLDETGLVYEITDDGRFLVPFEPEDAETDVFNIYIDFFGVSEDDPTQGAMSIYVYMGDVPRGAGPSLYRYLLTTSHDMNVAKFIINPDNEIYLTAEVPMLMVKDARGLAKLIYFVAANADAKYNELMTYLE